MIVDHRPTHPYGPFGEMYREFFELAPRYTGYEFGHAPQIKCSPPTVSFSQPVKWYSLDRARRLAAIRRVRDQYIEDIIRLGCGPREGRRESDRSGKEEALVVSHDQEKSAQAA